MKLTRRLLFAVIATLALAAAALAWRAVAQRSPAPAVSYTLLDGQKGAT